MTKHDGRKPAIREVTDHDLLRTLFILGRKARPLNRLRTYRNERWCPLKLGEQTDSERRTRFSCPARLYLAA